MPFVRIKGVVGQVYVPDKAGAAQGRHNCPECFSCQQCAHSRCQICLQDKPQTRTTGTGAGCSCVRPISD